MNVPKGTQTVIPYLMLHGALKFIDFTTKVFHAVLQQEKHHLSGDGNVMHSEITIGDSTIMFTEASGQWKVQTSNLFVYVDDADSTYHAALANGATMLLEPDNKDYGRTCGVTDPFGNVWWITSVNNNTQPGPRNKA